MIGRQVYPARMGEPDLFPQQFGEFFVRAHDHAAKFADRKPAPQRFLSDQFRQARENALRILFYFMDMLGDDEGGMGIGFFSFQEERVQVITLPGDFFHVCDRFLQVKGFLIQPRIDHHKAFQFLLPRFPYSAKMPDHENIVQADDAEAPQNPEQHHHRHVLVSQRERFAEEMAESEFDRVGSEIQSGAKKPGANRPVHVTAEVDDFGKQREAHVIKSGRQMDREATGEGFPRQHVQGDAESGHEKSCTNADKNRRNRREGNESEKKYGASQ